jgi:transposase-like protein
MRNPFRYFNSSPEVIRLTVMLYIRYPLSLRQVEDLLFERGLDICHEGIVRANSFTLPKRQNRISRPLIFLHFSGSI